MFNLMPYIIFNSQCEEALHFYETCLGGTIEEINRFGDSPLKISEEQKKQIMHARLNFWGGDICASDAMDTEKEPSPSSSRPQLVKLMLPFDDLQQAQTTFVKLAEGGQITMPLEKQFWGDTYGELTDKFGVQWLFDCSEPS